jgi:hypothetical protein
MRVSLVATVVSLVAVIPSGRDQAEAQEKQARQGASSTFGTAYPLAVIDRPGILPYQGALMTLTAARAGGNLQGSFGMVLGIPGNWELTGELTESEGTVSEAAVGLGGLLHMAGPFELDLRFSLPVHQEGDTLQDFSLGPACSYTLGSTGEVSGLADLMHVGFSEKLTLAMPVEIAIGFQPFQRLYLYASAILGEVGVVDTANSWVADRSPVDAGLIIGLSEHWDTGVTLSTSDIVGRHAEWSGGFFVSLKAVR